MRYTVTKHVIQVIGKIWMPNVTCAQTYYLDEYHIEQYGISLEQPTREQIERWISTNTGDFSTIEDFSANIGDNKIVPWENEESELTFNDCMFPGEDL